MTKKAVLVGINDYRSVYDLRGCLNDVTNMHNVLKTYFGFDHENIRVLTDNRATKRNILERLEWLIDSARPGDLLVFHFAGHGSQVLDRDELDELKDHKDEILCPWDMDWDGTFITDDTLNRLFRDLEEGVLLEVFLDCCHSGTGTRGLSLVSPEEEQSEDQIRIRYLEPPTDIQCRSLGEAYSIKGFTSASRSTLNHILWTGCRDVQESSDAYIAGEYSGAFTYYLCKHIRATNGNIARRELLARVSNSLNFHGYGQEPQLECDSRYEDLPFFSGSKAVPGATTKSSRKKILNTLKKRLGIERLPVQKRKEWFTKKREEWFNVVRTDAFKYFYDPRENTAFDKLSTPTPRGFIGLGMAIGNFFESLNRYFQYVNKKENPAVCRIVAEGDSWFLHPLLNDIIDWLSQDYAVSCLSAAGDEIKQMLKQNNFVHEIIEEQPQFFLLSGGGNDILGEEYFKYFLQEYKPPEPGKHPEGFVNRTFDEKLKAICRYYHTVFRRINESREIAEIYDAQNPLQILIHGYDYAIPGTVRKGQWLRLRMLDKGIWHPRDQNAIVRYMLDRFNTTIQTIPGSFSQMTKFRIHYVDLRGTLEKKANYDILEQRKLWDDEIHPTDEGFLYVAAKFKEKIEELRSSSD